MQVGSDALAVEVALHDFAVAGLARGVRRRVAVVDGEGGAVEVALGFKASLADEVFVGGFALLRRLLAEVGEQANGLEVDVENGVGIGEEANSVGCGALAEQDRGGDGAGDEQDGENDPEDTATMSHG